MNSQNEKVLARLKRGPITAREALNELGVMRLAARVKDLRDQGHEIVVEMIRVPTRDGDDARVALYSIRS